MPNTKIYYEIEEAAMFRRKLACSFCRRSEAEVAKLVSGPCVYICDRCAAEALRIMSESHQKDREATTAD
jgi:hypothetical protein